ncbi:MAG: cupin [Acidobacteria bacterium]|nr:cupin [Acidobacteriota bacterium]
MPTLIQKPTIIEAAGNKPKTIAEFIGRVNTGHKDISIAQMNSPEGWVEPGQRPEFTEITLVISGMLLVKSENELWLEVHAGQAVITHPGEWVQYSSPNPGGCQYVAVCLPAFSPDTVNRDGDT